MMIPRLRSGEELTPALLNRVIDGVNAAQVSSSDLALERTTAGTKLSIPQKQLDFYAIIKESPDRYKVGGEVFAGEYEWAEVVLTEEGFAEFPDPEVGLASHYDVSTGLLQNPAYDLNNNRTLEPGTIVRMWPYPPIEDRERGFLRRYIFSIQTPPQDRFWVKAQKNWTKQYRVWHPYVWVRKCDIDGQGERGEPFIVYLPRTAGQEPNVIQGDVVVAGPISEGIWVCLSDYLDEQFGTVVWFNTKSTDLEHAIRPGWKLCDGRFGTPDLQGRFIMGIGDGGEADEADIGDTGGFRDHGAGANTHDDHVDHLLSLDDGCFISALGGESGGGVGTACPGAGAPGQTDIADGHQHDLTMTWFYKVGFDWSVHPGGLITLTHNIHSLTDNRPRYYVLAAKMRIDNSE